MRAWRHNPGKTVPLGRLVGVSCSGFIGLMLLNLGWEIVLHEMTSLGEVYVPRP